MLLPLGLGLRFPRLPIVTLVLAFGLVCLFIADLPASNRADKRLEELLHSDDFKQIRLSLLVEYCEAVGGARDMCAELRKDRDAKPKAEKKKQLKEVLEDTAAWVALKDKLDPFDNELGAQSDRVRGLKSYPKYESMVAVAKEQMTAIQRQYDLFSTTNPTPKAFLLAQFRHAGWLHLIGNLFALIAFGAYVELRMGGFIYLMTYLLGGVLGIGGSILMSTSHVHIVGASANISAIMGAFFVAFFQYRMKFLVISLFGVRTFFGQVAVFFPMIYIVTDLLGVVEQRSGVFTGGTASDAHLIGLAIGMLVGAIDRKTTRLRWPFIYPDEGSRTLALQKVDDIDAKIKAAEQLLRFNPENVYARLLPLGDICYAGGPTTSESARFLGQHMSACASIQIRKHKSASVNEMLDSLAIEAPFPKILSTLGSKNLIKLADKALDDDNLLLALRLLDCFVQRFPKTRVAQAVRKTMSEILQHVKADEPMKAYVKRYITLHPNHALPIAIGRPPAPVTSPAPRGTPHVA